MTYAQAQTAGNFNVVVVGWNSSAGAGAVGHRLEGQRIRPRRRADGLRRASRRRASTTPPNIAAAAAGANTVTVTFSAAAPFPDIRIAEYRGIATSNPVDVAVAAQGSGTSSSSGPLTTTNANDLLVGANIVQTGTTAAGASFTSRGHHRPRRRHPRRPDRHRDGQLTPPRRRSHLRQLDHADGRLQGGRLRSPIRNRRRRPGNLAATAISQGQINLSWTAATDNVGVTGYRIERCQGAGCTTFAEIAAPVGTATTFSDTTASSAITSYSYRVRAIDAAGNLGPYSNDRAAPRRWRRTRRRRRRLAR